MSNIFREELTKHRRISNRTFHHHKQLTEESIYEWDGKYRLIWARPRMENSAVDDLPNPVCYKDFTGWFDASEGSEVCARLKVRQAYEDIWFVCECGRPLYRHNHVGNVFYCTYPYSTDSITRAPILDESTSQFRQTQSKLITDFLQTMMM